MEVIFIEFNHCCTLKAIGGGGGGGGVEKRLAGNRKHVALNCFQIRTLPYNIYHSQC